MRVFKIEGYVLDKDEEYDEMAIQDTIEIDALANLRKADSFVKVTDWSSNNCNKKNESKQNLSCKNCKSWVPIENTMEMIFSGLTVNANGYCHRLNSWIDSCDYCAYFSEKHSPDDSNCKLKKGDE